MWTHYIICSDVPANARGPNVCSISQHNAQFNDTARKQRLVLPKINAEEKRADMGYIRLQAAASFRRREASVSVSRLITASESRFKCSCASAPHEPSGPNQLLRVSHSSLTTQLYNSIQWSSYSATFILIFHHHHHPDAVAAIRILQQHAQTRSAAPQQIPKV